MKTEQQANHRVVVGEGQGTTEEVICVPYLGIHFDRMLTYRKQVETIALKCKKGLSVLKATAAKGIERHRFLL